MADAEASGPVAASDQVRAVDGLRAISILAVVGYHVGLSFMPGGFVGVDVFLVISGYLIINQIVGGLGAGFSFPEFWGRRALRILPPYLLVIVASSLIALFVLVLPAEHADFGHQALYSAGMVVNHYFLEQQGYFDVASDTKPLLHLWSLAVEEQFYLVAPLVLFGGWTAIRRASGRAARAALTYGVPALMMGASLLLCARYTDDDRNLAFFVMPLRAWEFILGGALGLALPHARRLPKWALEALAAAGLSAIAAAVGLLSAETPFPSLWALIPVLGASLVIVASLAHPGTAVARLLALRPMESLGRWSYAWYLWHWPLLTFGRIANFHHKKPALDAALVGVALVLAVLTHVLLEQPIRRRRHALTKGRGWRPALIGLLGCLAVAGVGLGFIHYVAPAAGKTITAAWAPTYDAVDRACRIDLMDSPEACLARSPGAPVGLLMGDSQSKAAHGSFHAAAQGQGALLTGLAMGGCAPFFHVTKHGRSATRKATCATIEGAARKSLDDPRMRISFAILTGLWTSHEHDLTYPDAEAPARDQEKIFVEKLEETLQLLREKGAKRFIVMGQVPVFTRNSPPECIQRADRYGLSRAGHCTITRKGYLGSRRKSHGWLTRALARHPDVRFVDPADVFCDDKLCMPYDDEGALYINPSHLSNAGARRIYEAFEGDFDWVFGAGR